MKTNKTTTEIIKTELHRKESMLDGKQKVIDAQAAHIRALEHQVYTYQTAFWWKITKPMRSLTDTVRAFLRPGAYNPEKIKTPLYKPYTGSHVNLAEKLWYVSTEEKQRQRSHKPGKNIKISIIVPLYNTRETHLKDMIDSVIKQTYTNWELCLADGSMPGYEYIKKICTRLARKYKGKIIYKKLDKNYGISGNSNECIKLSAGDYIALLDHDDALHPSALYHAAKAIDDENADFIYTDECRFEEYLKDAFLPFFKPDFAPDTLRGCNYICHLTVFKKQLLDKTGLFKSEYDGSQDYDLILRLTEQAGKIVHIPKTLYFWRTLTTSVTATTGADSYPFTAAVNAISAHLQRLGLDGKVLRTAERWFYRIKYELKGNPLISILIPNCNHADLLENCIESILQKTTYGNFEIIIIENNSTQPDTFEYYKSLDNNRKIKLLTYTGSFNFSKINNYAVSKASGEYIVLLNNDTEIISENWLEEMLMFAQREDVGAAGAMLYYPDGTIQHAGVILALGQTASHLHYNDGSRRGDSGYFGRLMTAQNLSCVTGACMMLKKSIYLQAGGLNEDFAVAWGDIDLCLKIRKAGYLIVWTPFAELYHYESVSRGRDETECDKKTSALETEMFKELWSEELKAGDPYYNVNLTLERPDFGMR